jgi:hypothetical protein
MAKAQLTESVKHKIGCPADRVEQYAFGPTSEGRTGTTARCSDCGNQVSRFDDTGEEVRG